MENQINPPKTTDSNNEAEVINSVLNDTLQHAIEVDATVELESYDTLERSQLLELLEKYINEGDFNQTKAQIGSIKVAFINQTKEIKNHQLEDFLNNGGVKEEFVTEPDELEIKFNEVFKVYKEKKNKITEEAEKQKTENFILKTQIIEDLKKLIDSEEELKKTYDAFRELQEKWKLIGPVPQKENNTLWQNYNFLVEKFFDKIRINNELKELDLKKNLENKIALCEKVEELILEENIKKAFSLLQKYHETWREIGPVPADKRDEVWERFRNATEKINNQRKEHYQKLQDELQNNYQAKLVLCEKAEQLSETIPTNGKEWQERSEQMLELQKMWKTIGFAPKKVNNEIWQRFKNASNNFFNTKKEFFGNLKSEQINNYNLKLNICVQAEALKDSLDWKKTTDELIKLQQEWKKIGPVPRKYSDKIWKRFRAACDEFFNKRASYFANVDQIEAENQKKKEELIEKVAQYQFTEDNSQNLEILKTFQREWLDIGHVPIKVKEQLQAKFREIINQHYDKLKISQKEKLSLDYKSKIDNIKNLPNADKAIGKEKSFLINRIASLKSDISLWENNIGFLANSKKADLLKDEFLKRIEKAKQEVASLEEKLKLLRDK